MKGFQNILCVVQSGEASKTVLERAVTLAENNQASLAVVALAERVRVSGGLPEAGSAAAGVQQALVSAEAQALESLIEPFRERIDISTKVLIGVPFLQIVREVLSQGHDLVVKAPENPEWLDRLLGSDDMHLLRKCPCPVWLIKPSSASTHKRILAAVDAGEDYQPAELGARRALSLQILEVASSLALSEFAELHVVHVWDAVGESAMRGAFMRRPEGEVVAYVEQVRSEHAASLSRLMEEAAARLGEDAVGYLKPQIHLLKGWAQKEVPLLADQLDVDLVVMGTVGRTGIPGFIMGNTAEAILSQLDCSVLAIKPPGFVTPVTLER